jgi:GT2 family glycosyltransferase
MEKVASQCAADISISVVSHSQIDLVAQLLFDLDSSCRDSNFELILTLNLDETLPFELGSFSFPIKLVRNTTPKGFGANHNQAFRQASGRYFCVMNPDIRLSGNPFSALLAVLEDSTVGVVAPLVVDEDGAIEDSARRFPTPLKILCKALGRCQGSDYAIKDALVYPDWVGGMFMLFPRRIFEQLAGFDERYFLYYEDVDLCGRLRLLGYEVMVNPQVKVTHHAQRTSRRSFTYLRWHFRSMMRFFLSPVFWQLQRLARP